MEISLEEKKAIEFIKDLIAWDVRQDLCPNKEECENLEIILNLIEKLQKENERLKEEKEQAWEEWNNLEQGSYETEQKLKKQIKKLQKKMRN